MYQTDAFCCCIIMAVIVVGALPCHPSHSTLTVHRSLHLQTHPLIIPHCCSVALKICLLTTSVPTVSLMSSKDPS